MGLQASVHGSFANSDCIDTRIGVPPPSRPDEQGLATPDLVDWFALSNALVLTTASVASRHCILAVGILCFAALHTSDKVVAKMLPAFAAPVSI